MEDDKETKDESRLDIKFEKIMESYNPIFVAFFLRSARSVEGVIFEIGCLCCKSGCESVGERLMLLSDKKYDYKRSALLSVKSLPANFSHGLGGVCRLVLAATDTCH
jgi:hypothetical protein